MSALVATPTKPANIERLRVIVVVGLNWVIPRIGLLAVLADEWSGEFTSAECLSNQPMRCEVNGVLHVEPYSFDRPASCT